MKKTKAPKAKNVQPVVLTMDTLIELVKDMEYLKAKITALQARNEELVDLAACAYPERTTDGLKFKFFTENGEENFALVKV